ncbi:hypothetical protein Tco_1398119 [Tanacetum coccineum]
MAFSKQPGKNTLQCYTKPLDSLKNWNNRFFWVDEKVFPTSAPKDGMPAGNTYSAEGVMDLFNLIRALNPAIVKTGTRQRAAHEVPLLTAMASGVIDMEDVVATSTSSSLPVAMDQSPLDFSNKDPTPLITNQDETKSHILVIAMGVLKNKRRRKRDRSETEANEPPKVLTIDHAFVRPALNTHEGKSLAFIGEGAGSTVPTCTLQEIPTDVIEPDALSYARPQSVPERDTTQPSKETAIARDPDSEKSTSFMFLAGSPSGIYQPGWGITNNCHLDTPEECQDMVDHFVPPGYFAELHHLPNLEFLG